MQLGRGGDGEAATEGDGSACGGRGGACGGNGGARWSVVQVPKHVCHVGEKDDRSLTQFLVSESQYGWSEGHMQPGGGGGGEGVAGW
eukprot:2777498-Prymnesium_polylepis.1